MNRWIMLILIGLFFATPVYAVDDESNWVLGSIHDELVECYAYYGFIKAISENSGEMEAVKKV